MLPTDNKMIGSRSKTNKINIHVCVCVCVRVGQNMSENVRLWLAIQMNCVERKRVVVHCNDVNLPHSKLCSIALASKQKLL